MRARFVFLPRCEGSHLARADLLPIEIDVNTETFDRPTADRIAAAVVASARRYFNTRRVALTGHHLKDSR